MNIKEIKRNYEDATKILISTMVDKTVGVSTAYDVNKDEMMVVLTSTSTGANKEPINVIYTITYGVDAKTISVAAIARHILSDSFGVSNIIYEPIFIDEPFITNMKTGISSAIENCEDIVASAAAKAKEESEAADAATANVAASDDVTA